MDALVHFNPQGPRGPRLLLSSLLRYSTVFQSTRPSRASTSSTGRSNAAPTYFNPQGPRGPRPYPVSEQVARIGFQSTRPSRASTPPRFRIAISFLFQSTRPSRASTTSSSVVPSSNPNFNPQGPRGPRPGSQRMGLRTHHFNPQGPRGPRQQNYPTIPPHPPNFLCIMSPPPPYFNLLHPFTQPIFTAFPLFFRCESPGHFMLAWHSHLV